ncbi:MAG: arginine--tRNA ligase [Campylobacterales bacterium]|nr:arginine--tRNA ligase [Campylobacterales bacterium]
MKLKSTIDAIISKALHSANIQNPNLSVTKAAKKEFGDFQYNGAMGLAKKLQTNPREIATSITTHIDAEIIEKVEIAGAGFINIWLKNSWLSSELKKISQDECLGIEKAQTKENIIVDYSGPNMAKEMHVGHLRSTIIGDTLANLFEFLGHNVIRQNHIGDWGTQFGMLVAYLEELQSSGDFQENLKDLEEFYKLAKKRFDEDAAFADKAREYVVKIQSGDAHCLKLWKRFIDISLAHCEEVYQKLHIKLTRDDVKAESYYNDMLSQVVQKLDAMSMLSVSEGAKCVFLPFSDIPLIVQKSDGGYLYATTDLGALWYRNDTLKADKILYVVDARQNEHFKSVFWVAKEAKMVRDDVVLKHIAFGTMMNEQGKPFKTRDGGTLKLTDLIDEAIIRAKNTLKDKEDAQGIEHKAKTIGIGALKYADLSVNRESNYIFNWDRMLSFDGNTALYMQYAYARIQSIIRKYVGTFDGDIKIESESERALALALLDFEDVLYKSAHECMPNHITGYLYELATLFMRFYEQSPILKEGIDGETKISRLLLSKITADTIKQGLAILGIETLEQI